jgi:hypothetical protein
MSGATVSRHFSPKGVASCTDRDREIAKALDDGVDVTILMARYGVGRDSVYKARERVQNAYYDARLLAGAPKGRSVPPGYWIGWVREKVQLRHRIGSRTKTLGQFESVREAELAARDHAEANPR